VKRLECGLMCLQAVVEGQPMDKRDARKAGRFLGKAAKIAKIAMPFIRPG